MVFLPIEPPLGTRKTRANPFAHHEPTYREHIKVPERVVITVNHLFAAARSCTFRCYQYEKMPEEGKDAHHQLTSF